MSGMAATMLGLVAIAVTLGALWHYERGRRIAAAAEAKKDREQLEATHEAALRERTAQLEAVLNQMLEALIAIDGQGRVRLANRAAARLFGFEEGVIGKTLMEVVRQHEVQVVVERLKMEREVRDQEIHLEGPVLRQARVNAVALAGAGGALLVFHDVTELRRLESLRHDFVANVSHELRTPLSLIASAVETLLDGAKEEPETRDRFLTIIDRHTARLGLLIEDLLLLSALDSGRIQLNQQTVLLCDVVAEVVSDLDPTAAERGVKLHSTVDRASWVRADALRLRQILSNLIDNAIKHGRANGRVTVSATRPAPEWLQVAVQDDGPGIPAEARTRVFERFYRVEKSRARQQGGTGLGLAIVKNLVFAHGGEVKVESGEGQGTTFYFTLPAASTAEVVADLVPGARFPRSGE